MTNPKLPLDDANDQPGRGGKPKYAIEMLTYEQTRVSIYNPRYDVVISDESVEPLVAKIRATGQIHDAIGWRAADGIVDLDAGARRREGMRILGKPLRVRVFDELSAERSIRIAYRDGSGSAAVSFWDTSASWKRLLDDKVVTGEAKLGELIDEDKSVINRGLALQRAPAEVLDLFADRQAISQTQWMVLAPLLEDGKTRERILLAAGNMIGQTFAAAALVKKLTVAAAGKQEIKPRDVLNKHGRVMATITPDHKSGFAIKVKPMAELHPSYRIDYAKLVHAAFLEVLKQWFGDG
ncbi:MAG: ParB/RepB/Spo0J family partition protein [Janthinobacterium lividum]